MSSESDLTIVQFSQNSINTSIVDASIYQFLEFIFLSSSPNGKPETSRLTIPVGNSLLPYYATGDSVFVIGIPEKGVEWEKTDKYAWGVPVSVTEGSEVVVQGPTTPELLESQLSFNYAGENSYNPLIARKIEDLDGRLPGVVKKLGYESVESFHKGRVYPEL